MSQLNALVAKHIFGLDPVGILITRIGWVKEPDTYPDYEYDGNAMLAVIDKMFERQWTVRVINDHSHDGGWATFCCGPTSGRDGHPEFKAEGATLPQAVAIAALMALGVEIPKEYREDLVLWANGEMVE